MAGFLSISFASVNGSKTRIKILPHIFVPLAPTGLYEIQVNALRRTFLNNIFPFKFHLL